MRTAVLGLANDRSLWVDTHSKPSKHTKRCQPLIGKRRDLLASISGSELVSERLDGPNGGSPSELTTMILERGGAVEGVSRLRSMANLSARSAPAVALGHRMARRQRQDWTQWRRTDATRPVRAPAPWNRIPVARRGSKDARQTMSCGAEPSNGRTGTSRLPRRKYRTAALAVRNSLNLAKTSRASSSKTKTRPVALYVVKLRDSRNNVAT
jgi:hypothetical protein